MPLIPISTNVEGADLNTGSQGLVGAALANVGNVVQDMSLQIGEKLRNEEAVQTVASTRAAREFESKQKIAELKADSPDGYMWEVKDGKRQQVRNPDGTQKSITSAYRDWANEKFESDQKRMPSRVAQDLYVREMLPDFTDNISVVQGHEFSKRQGATKGKAVEAGNIRAMDVYTAPGHLSDVYEKSKANVAQNASLVSVDGITASELPLMDAAQSDQLAENWGEGIYRNANETVTTGGTLPTRYLEDAYDAWVGDVKPGNQFEDHVRHGEKTKARAQWAEENKKRVAMGEPELAFPEELKTITSMATDETRDRIALKLLSLMKTKQHRVDVEFSSETEGLAAFGKSKILTPQARREYRGQVADYEQRTLQYVAEGTVLPLKAAQGIAHVRASDKIGSFLGSRNYWALTEKEKIDTEKAGAAEAIKVGEDLYGYFQKNALMKNKFSKDAIVGIAKLEFEKALATERETIKTGLRNNTASVAQEYNPVYAATAKLIDPNAPEGLAAQIKAKGRQAGKVWDGQAAQSDRATGIERGRNNFLLDDPQLQSWAKALDNPNTNAKQLADFFEAAPIMGVANAQRIMDGMIKNGLPEQYAAGLLVKDDRFMREQVAQVLVEKGVNKSEDEYRKNFPQNMDKLEKTIQEGIQPYLPELEKMEAMRGRNTGLIINTLAATARINAVAAARRQTEFDADKAVASGVEATFGRLFVKSEVNGHTVIAPRVRVQRVQGPGGKVVEKPIIQDEQTTNKTAVFFSRMRKDPEIFLQQHPNIIIPDGLDRESFKIRLRDTLETGLTKKGDGYGIRVNLNTKNSSVGVVDLMEKDERGNRVPVIMKTDDILRLQNKHDEENPGWFKSFWNNATKKPFPVRGAGPKF